MIKAPNHQKEAKNEEDEEEFPSVLFEQPINEKTPIPVVVNDFFMRSADDPELPHFKFKANTTITIYGKRGTGKSFWLRWFLYNYRDVYPIGWVFTKTKNNRFFESFVPSSHIFHGYQPEKLRQIIKRQKMAQKLMLDGANINPLAFVIWDDTMDNLIKYDDELSSYYFTSRHFHTINIMTAQYVKSTPPAIRQNTDHAVIFANSNIEAVDVLAQDFAINKDKNQFQRLINECTQDRHFLFVDNDPNKPYDKRYYWGKAEETPDFVCGSEEYWERDMEQLRSIMSGKFKRDTETIKKWTDPEYAKNFPDKNRIKEDPRDTVRNDRPDND